MAIANKRDYPPFFLSLALFALSYAGLGISMYPYIVPQSITIWQAASPRDSQFFMLVGVAVLIPLILGYTSWAYWVFRGKVRNGGGYHLRRESKNRDRWRNACCGSLPFGSAGSAPSPSCPTA
jgi:cytochrome bd ubiquinol oxidase subunit II